MLISVIVCTYCRTQALTNLLGSLAKQDGADFEVLIVDGSGENLSVRIAVETFLRDRPSMRANLRLIGSPKGLTRQRNCGLDHARGEIICFLDDDVTLQPDVLRRVAEIFVRPDFSDVGGLTAYDLHNYPTPVTVKWRLRRWLRIVPKLVPGAMDRLGRAVPVSFLKRFDGAREIAYLPGFFMAYRRSAIGTLRFDEQLPTYAGEDRDFSFRAGRHARLLIFGDLHVRHHYERESREPYAARIYQDGFGSGRIFAKCARKTDRLELVRFLVLDALVNLLGTLQRPSVAKLQGAVARTRGIAAGYRSWIAERQSKTGAPRPALEEIG